MPSRPTQEIEPSRRYSVVSAEGARVTETSLPDSGTLHTVPAGTIVVAVEVVPSKGGAKRVRISSPSGWVDAADLGEATAPTSLHYDAETFSRHHLEVARGDLYDIEFPFTIESIEKFGAEFLTKAFHATGTLDRNNRVVAIERVEPCAGGQAADKALLDVEYEKLEPGLATKLFVKVPSSDAERKLFLASTVPFEVEVARLSAGGALPVDVPRYYFGDYCAKTSNYILITERIGFGEDGIAPACDKGRDHELSDARERYLVLAKALASLAAAHKCGEMGYGLESSFPFPRKASQRSMSGEAEEQLDKLIAFIETRAPNLFPEWATQRAFLAEFREDVLLGLSNAATLARHLHDNVDYVALCHPNLNLDNAWFWNEPNGALRVGLLDWGMTRQMSFGEALLGMLMFPEPEIYSELVRDVTRTFVSEFVAETHLQLDAETLHHQLKASLFMTSLPMILSIVVDQFAYIPDEAYQSMEDRFDPHLVQSGLGTAVVWVRNVLEEWHDETTPGDVCRSILATKR